MKAAQLRQAILQAAVQGKLVPQNPHDEPASELLKRIQAGKPQLTPKSALKNENLAPPIDEDETPYNLPDGWEWCRVKQLTTLITSGSRDWAKYYSQSGAIFLRMGNLSKDSFKLRLHSIQYVSPPNNGEGTRTKLEPNDILVSITGDVGMLGLIPHGFGEAYINQHTAVVRFFPEIHNQLFPFFFLSPFCQEQFKGPQRGIKNSFRLTDLEKMIVPLPPVAEQQRIVDKLNEFMTLCGELESAEKEFDSLETNLAEYLPKSILQAAVQGKLVPQNIHEEPASELLKRIQAGKFRLIKDGKLKKEKPLSPISEEEIPYDLPNGWEWCRLGDVANLINGDRGKNYPSKDKLSLEGIPFISAVDIENDTISNSKLLCLSRGQYETLGNGKLIRGDIVFCIRGSLGKCGVYPFNEGAIASSLVIIRIADTDIVNSKYLLNYLKSPLLFSEIRKHDNGTAQPNLSAENLKNFLIPFAPQAEQQRIVAKIDVLMALCEQLKNIDPDSALPLADMQEILPSLEIPTPSEPEEQYAMAARGDVSTTETKEHRQAIEDLFGDGADG